MKIQLFNIANMPKYGYIYRALCKITKLALVGYISLAYKVRFGLFLYVKSLCVRISMAKLERDTLACAGNLMSQSTNPFQLCHHYLVVTGKASNQSLGAH